MKYRKKPVIIDAEQFHSLDWLKNHSPKPVYMEQYGDETVKFFCDTLEGRHEVSEGDWIITGIKGEHYPCKPDIFEMTYEKENNDS